jgi:hypothetical protein
MSSEALGNKRRARTPDVPNAPDPQSENTSDELDGAIDYEIERVCAFFSDFYASLRICSRVDSLMKSPQRKHLVDFCSTP